MQTKKLTTLGVAAAAAMLLAAVVLWQQRPDGAGDKVLLLPSFADRLADVAVLDITASNARVRLEQKDSQWVVADKAGYPADGALVRRLLLSAAAVRVVEEKTSDPTKYARLGVEDTASPNAASTQVDFKTVDGTVLAGVIVGKAASAASGGEARRYARVVGEKTSYLVTGLMDVKASAAEWLDETLLSVDQARVKQVTVIASGQPLHLMREKPEDDFQLAELPKDRKLKAYGGVDSLTAALAYLSFDDVRPAEAMPDTAKRTAITTFDGLTVTVTMDGGWAHFSAAYDVGVTTAEGEAVMPKAPSDVAAEADGINARLGRWDYKLPDFKVKDLTPALNDLLEPLPEKDKGKK
jgi:hypothetical protein